MKKPNLQNASITKSWIRKKTSTTFTNLNLPTTSASSEPELELTPKHTGIMSTIVKLELNHNYVHVRTSVSNNWIKQDAISDEPTSDMKDTYTVISWAEKCPSVVMSEAPTHQQAWESTTFCLVKNHIVEEAEFTKGFNYEKLD